MLDVCSRGTEGWEEDDRVESRAMAKKEGFPYFHFPGTNL